MEKKKKLNNKSLTKSEKRKKATGHHSHLNACNNRPLFFFFETIPKQESSYSLSCRRSFVLQEEMPGVVYSRLVNCPDPADGVGRVDPRHSPALHVPGREAGEDRSLRSKILGSAAPFPDKWVLTCRVEKAKTLTPY
jgi:hypothetical protein